MPTDNTVCPKMSVLTTKVEMNSVMTVIFVLASLTSTVLSMKCWQCAAVDGRKCPEDAKSVTSVGNVNLYHIRHCPINDVTHDIEWFPIQ